MKNEIEKIDENTKLLVTIPFEEYSRLTTLQFEFNKIVKMYHDSMEHQYRSLIRQLELDNERLRNRKR